MRVASGRTSKEVKFRYRASILGFSVIDRLRYDIGLPYLYTGPKKASCRRTGELEWTVDIPNLRDGVFVSKTFCIGGQENYTLCLAILIFK